MICLSALTFSYARGTMAKATQAGLGTKFLREAQARLKKHHLQQIIKSLESLTDQQIWQVSLLLRNADKLPPEASAVFALAPPTQPAKSATPSKRR